MKNKLLAWFKVNKILIPFILLSLAVWIVVPLSLMPRPAQVEEDIPLVEIGRFDLETGDAILLYQKGDNLVAHFEQTVHHSDGDVRETKSTVFVKVFDRIPDNRINQTSAERIQSLYQEYLPKLAHFQKNNPGSDGLIPAFGLSQYEAVKQMSINGQKVEQVKTYTDSNGKEWYLWFYSNLPLKESDNLVELKPSEER